MRVLLGIALFTVAIAALSAPMRAQQSSRCGLVAAIDAYRAEPDEPGRQKLNIVELTVEQRDRVTVAFNKIQPASDVHPPRIWIAARGDSSVMVFTAVEAMPTLMCWSVFHGDESRAIMEAVEGGTPS